LVTCEESVLFREVEQDSAPDKRVYSLTQLGRDSLTDWLENSSAGIDVVKSPMLLRAFFGLEMSPSSMVEQLKSYRDQAEHDQQAVLHWMDSLGDSDSAFFSGLTIRFGLAYKTAAMEWADEAIREIESRFGERGDA
jgi:hypothetical protein